MSYLGNAPGVSSQRTVTREIVSVASKTAFVPISGYSLGYVDVYVNGLQLDDTDFTATDGVNVNLVTAALNGDLVRIVAWLPRGLSDGYLKSEADAKFAPIAAPTFTGVATFSKGSTSGVTIGDVSTNSNSVLRLQGTSAGYNWQIANNLNVAGIEFTPSTATGGTTYTTPAVTFLSNGNVGIGMTSPTYKLDVTSASAVVGRVISSGSTQAFFAIRNSGGAQGYVSVDASNIYLGSTVGSTGNKFAVSLSTPDNSVIIDSSGNVGINQSAPSYRLDVSGTLRSGVIYRDFSDNVEQYLIRGSATTAYQPFIAYLPSGGTATRGFRFGAWNNLGTETEWMRLWDGNLQLGITTPNAGVRLNVYGTDTASGTWSCMFSSGSGSNKFGVRNDGYIYAAGAYNTTTASAANAVLAADGYLYRSTSSIKYKRDVVDYSRGIADVMKLRPVFYKGKAECDGEDTFAGLIAEEVEEAGLNEYVVRNSDGEVEALAYQNMVALAFKAIQEQQALITQLQADVKTLKEAA